MSKNNSGNECSLCQFFKSTDNTCRYEAPVAFVSNKIQGVVTIEEVGTSIWPQVLPADWCGRFLAGPYKG